MLALNVGCGSNKIEGYINIDTEESCKPDLIHNMLEKPLPYETGTVDRILFFHCIEHIRKGYHLGILAEFYRVLKPEGQIFISYPNFWECARLWHDNAGAKRNFWEATIFGRQLYETDYHVCAMNPDELAEMLDRCGFKQIISCPEPNEPYNAITFALKGDIVVSNYEQLVANNIKKESFTVETAR